MRCRRSTGVALHQPYFVAVHTLEGDHFGGEVIPVHRFLATVAHRTGQQPVASANLARRARVRTLKPCANTIVSYIINYNDVINSLTLYRMIRMWIYYNNV